VKVNQAAFDVGQLAERMAQGYYMHTAAVMLATDVRARAISPGILPGQIVPVGYVRRKDGTQHVFAFGHFLGQARAMTDDLARIWLVGSLLAVGDALWVHSYFDRAPELELVRHLRNGVAHGNAFRIGNPASLQRFPAHNRLAWVRGDGQAEFEITADLHNRPVLFDFMGPGDVLDLLMSVGVYLTRMGTGDPLRP
jgi:hypothetical protein